MSVTRILCTACGFPQVYCACGRITDGPKQEPMTTPTQPDPAMECAKEIQNKIMAALGSIPLPVGHEAMSAHDIAMFATIIRKHYLLAGEGEARACGRLPEPPDGLYREAQPPPSEPTDGEMLDWLEVAPGPGYRVDEVMDLWSKTPGTIRSAIRAAMARSQEKGGSE